MSLDTLLTELRDLLHPPPLSASRWKVLCQRLDAFTGDAASLQVALDYVNTHAEGSLAAHRTAPAKWALQALDPEVEQPRLQIVRTLDLSALGRGAVSPRRFALDGAHLLAVQPTAAHLAALCANPYLSALEELDLSNNKLPDAAGKPLAACTSMHQLSRLNLKSNHLSASLGAIVRSPLVRSLRHLNLAYNDAERYSEPADGLATTDQLTALETLELDFTYYGAWEDVSWIAANPHLPQRLRDALDAEAAELQRYEEEHE